MPRTSSRSSSDGRWTASGPWRASRPPRSRSPSSSLWRSACSCRCQRNGCFPGSRPGFVATIGYLALFAGLRLGTIFVVGPIIAANGALAAVLAVMFLGESHLPAQALGAVIATAGVLVTGVDFRRDWRLTRLTGPGVALGVVSMVASAVQTVVLVAPSRDLGWPGAFLLSRVTTAVTVIAAVAAAVSWLARAEPPTGGARLGPGRRGALFALGGICSALGFVAFAAGLEISHAWLMGITSALAPVMVLVVGVAAFGERLSRVQWLGCALVVLSLPVIAAA